eukprot:3603059-Alexandrium_andersonii.AAC.1
MPNSRLVVTVAADFVYARVMEMKSDHPLIRQSGNSCKPWLLARESPGNSAAAGPSLQSCH